MTKKKRKKFTAEEKVSILRRHHLEKVPVSELCDEVRIAPTLFYRWQKEFYENGAAAFARNTDKKERRQKERIESLESQLTRKNEVVSHLMEEHVALKKVLGRFDGSLG